MEKENFDHVQNQTSGSLKGKENEQVLEISSTGYGLESVSNENSEKLQSIKSDLK
ncbi:hypothetical protein [Neobacillus mesonae]|uniref:hypothetical protein n=1 Tax=Neobacillus mesonae TaxID=1193713 RepID=UPI000A91CD6E|nr:hypothetical protein [Neobacillus mesonae]